MFGLFKKRHKEESVSLAKSAAISPVYEKGNYSAFLVEVDGNYSSLIDHFKHQDLLEEFVRCIETRIQNGEFDDPMDDDGQYVNSIPRSETGFIPNLNVKRAVVFQDKVLFSWDHDKSDQ
ncbi:hypothetical protein [Nitrosomonas sp.]|uniref:hypothetical protein n=1 Tax=Nitrosomonas sp. TaxID=42353 RepID=UPI00285142AA|nr:hypothetical protein [Nitrosomonas sp.]MDR4514577.1 hypothetical protein [Nitrosomonas sp.]